MFNSFSSDQTGCPFAAGGANNQKPPSGNAIKEVNMPEDVILGKGREFKKISRDFWEKEVATRAAHVPAILDFMTPEHHQVRYLLVEEIARTEKPLAPEAISAKLDMATSKVVAILDDLEKNLFFWSATAGGASSGLSR